MLFLFVLLLDALNTNFFLAALPNLLGVIAWQSDLEQPPLELGPSPGPLDCCKYPHGTHGGRWGMPLTDHGIPGHHGQRTSMHKLDVLYKSISNQYTYGDVPVPWYVIGQLALKPLKLTKMQEVLLSVVLQSKRKSSPCGEKLAPAQGQLSNKNHQLLDYPICFAFTFKGHQRLLRFGIQHRPGGFFAHGL